MAINFPPLHHGRRIFADFAMCNCFSKNLGLGNLVDALIKTNNLSDLPDKAASRTNLGVPKGVDKQMCSAWASFANTGSAITTYESLNISSITRISFGYYRVNFATPLNSAGYSIIGTTSDADAGACIFSACNSTGVIVRSTTAFEFTTRDGDTNVLKDPGLINFLILGGI
ncbi:TPA: hypothetical protein ACJI8J_000305 [Kluyvera georgiana]